MLNPSEADLKMPGAGDPSSATKIYIRLNPVLPVTLIGGFDKESRSDYYRYKSEPKKRRCDDSE